MQAPASLARVSTLASGVDLFKGRLEQLRLKFISFQHNTLTVQYHRHIPNTMEGVVYKKMLQERIVQAIQDDAVVTVYFQGLSRIDIQTPPPPEKKPASPGKK